MIIFNKPLSEYLAFQKVMLLLTIVVGVARLALSLGGVGNPTVKWLSITIVGIIGLVYYAIRVHTSGFGSYKQLLALIVIQNIVAQAIIIAGIVIAIVTHKDNIFSAPEYSPTADGKTWLHAGMHLVLGVVVGSLLWWGIGSVIMWVTKKVTSTPVAENA
jgi:lysylphosphatidylglycerol synthetase-like protein (DUF2156 family)